MTILRFFITPITAILLGTVATPALSCACCSDTGERVIRDIRVDKWIQEEMHRLRMAGTAHIFQTACGLECVRGIEDPQDTYQVSLTGHLSPWELTFSTNNMPVGTISFIAPLNMNLMMIDTNPDPQKVPGDLYKEWDAPITATGTGIFEKGLGEGTPGSFVFQGHGNRCTMAENFTNWHLNLNGVDAEFAFFGPLALPE